jgi:hypothetical protein
MRVYLFLALALAGGLFWFLWWFLRTPPERVAKYLRRGALVIGVLLLLVLAATGRLHWLFAVLGAGVAMVLRLLRLMPAIPLPLLQRLFSGLFGQHRQRGPAAGQGSSVQTRFLRMHLDHDSGEMDGEVVEGRFRGRGLGTLTLGELLALLNECRADTQSVTVLEAYLDRMHPDWRDSTDADDARRHAADGVMTEHEALEILGLEAGASRDEIIAAHRRLMQKLHPDRGGSDYLAAQINAAKDFLLNE